MEAEERIEGMVGHKPIGERGCWKRRRRGLRTIGRLWRDVRGAELPLVGGGDNFKENCIARHGENPIRAKDGRAADYHSREGDFQGDKKIWIVMSTNGARRSSKMRAITITLSQPTCRTSGKGVITQAQSASTSGRSLLVAQRMLNFKPMPSQTVVLRSAGEDELFHEPA